MSKSNRLKRRDFLIRARAGAALALPLVIRSRALGRDGAVAPSERLTAGCIGIGAQGYGDMRQFLGSRGVQVLAVSDVNRDHRDRAKAAVDGAYRNADCAASTDFREVLARDDIDLVMIAAPDHWHAIMAVEACRRGKDVYCEKPLSLTVKEGRAMVSAARRYGRVFSCGSQRVRGDYGRLADYVASGAIGRLREIYVGCPGPSEPCNLPGEPVPDWLDWDLWLGPAPWQPYHPGRIATYTQPAQYKGGETQWRMWRDFSGGGMTDWGAHNFGGAMYAARLDETGPLEIFPPDRKEHRYLTYVFANGIRMYHAGGMRFVGTAGEAPPILQPHPASPLRQYHGGTNSPIADFLHCVRTRRTPFRDVEYAHRVATVCHLGNIAYWLKRPLKWDPVKEVILGDEEAGRWLDRPRREPWRL